MGILGLRKGKKQDVEVVKRTENGKRQGQQGREVVKYNEDLVLQS